MIHHQNEFALALYFLTAMSIAAFAHVWWLQSPLSARWHQPLDFGRCIRRRRIFGHNKTLRGVMVLPAVAAISFPLLYSVLPEQTTAMLTPLASSSYAQIGLLGFCCGCGFMLGELPNSFIKRQLDIEPGKLASAPVPRCIFAVVDRLDSTITALLAASFLIPISVLSWFWVLLIGPGLHAIFSYILHQVGVKDRAL